MILILHPDGRFLALDATIDATFSNSVSVAKHPIERGAKTIDHVEPVNEEIILTCVMTETPTQRQADATFPGYGIQQVTSESVVEDDGTPAIVGKLGPDRITAVVDFLRDCVGELVDLVSSEGRFYSTDLLLTQFPYKWRLVRSSTFTLGFVKPRLIEATSVAIPPRAIVPATITDESEEAEGGTVEEDTRDQSTADVIVHALVGAVQGS